MRSPAGPSARAWGAVAGRRRWELRSAPRRRGCACLRRLGAPLQRRSPRPTTHRPPHAEQGVPAQLHVRQPAERPLCGRFTAPQLRRGVVRSHLIARLAPTARQMPPQHFTSIASRRQRRLRRRLAPFNRQVLLVPGEDKCGPGVLPRAIFATRQLAASWRDPE